MENKGLLVVISSPSGGGKTTVIRKVLELGNRAYKYSISATTRPQRPNEINGFDYLFVSDGEFNKMQKAGEFIEWAEVHGYKYATPKAQLERWLKEGKVVFLDLDVDGGLEIKKKYSGASTLIFIKPPSFQSLVQRLRERKTESQVQIEKRLERFPKEMKKSKLYDYEIVNRSLDNTAQQIINLVNNSLINNAGGNCI